ncbi:aminotransferase class III-fold pyridoxal phosphate-dependent enzyme [Candidatus Pelagibacter sp.]|nr:aminotransferase class III-fold pyridoxal phosphate-dependent enzyme [Candidatus Pelagibacter sp.]MDA7732114.1 aminotransferase class III-fold pyridoxal phosphate-dependent enzyme [Candidatus Pelagibacter sp.]MDC1483481.1 aminotransferase class III-fold pyridoxal phosphate-dependent enzyme [Pelagibacteraceae bacterium]
MKIKNGISLYKYAKTLIPGGTTLFSKRSELHLPYKWPAYFTKAKKINVWDLKGDKYLDMFCAVGTSVLGYGNAKVNKSVLKNIDKGNMTTLNCPEEVFLAKQMIKQHPWASMAKFTRSGGEANALAIRIARSFTKKKNVAFCGYHGWHDWYLSANINSKKNLDQHLMSGLNYDGIPENLKNTSFPFPYNNFEYLIKLINKKKIGIIKMEVMRNKEPQDNFLQKVRDLCNKKKIILIFDECTSGYREIMGGVHLKFKVNPDMAIFGKALGSGYAINAIIGKRQIMRKAENTFISSTFWGERIGYTAALASIKEFKRLNVFKKIENNGKMIKNIWYDLSKKYNVPIKVEGTNAIPSFEFCSNHLQRKTFLTQEMLRNKILATNVIYITIFHNKDNIKKYIKILDKVFYDISKKNIKSILKSKVCFKPINRIN